MKCDKCDNEANFEIHLIGGSGKKTIRLCKDCYMNYMNDFIPSGELGDENFKYFQDILSDLIGSILDKKTDFNINTVDNPSASILEDDIKEDKKCSSCGISLSEIVKTGKLGCSQCYEDFKSEVGEILVQTQGASEHKGKVPEKYEGLIIIKNEIEKKEEKLKDLIVNEDYEGAALIRDEIKGLRINLEKVDGELNG